MRKIYFATKSIFLLFLEGVSYITHLYIFNWTRKSKLNREQTRIWKLMKCALCADYIHIQSNTLCQFSLRWDHIYSKYKTYIHVYFQFKIDFYWLISPLYFCHKTYINFFNFISIMIRKQRKKLLVYLFICLQMTIFNCLFIEKIIYFVKYFL